MAYKIKRPKIKVYGIMIGDKKGNVVGEKIIPATSEEYILKNPRKFLGGDRKILAVRTTKIKDYEKWVSKPRSVRFPKPTDIKKYL